MLVILQAGLATSGAIRLGMDSQPPGLSEMTAGAALAREIFVDELAVARRPEARKMPAMHDGDRKGAYALHRLDIVAYPAVVDVVDQRSVIDDVAG